MEIDGRQNGKEYDLVVCSGGDGTLDEVVTGIIKQWLRRRPIGYIPAGSTNDFAQEASNMPKNMAESSGKSQSAAE